MNLNVLSHVWLMDAIFVSAVPSSILLDSSKRGSYPEPCILGALYSSPLATALPPGEKSSTPPELCVRPHITLEM